MFFFLIVYKGEKKNGHTLCYTYFTGLFRRVIIQSGSPLAHWSYSDKVTSPDIHFKIFVSSIGCLRNSSRLIKECLQNIPTEVMHRHIALKYVVGRKDINVYILRQDLKIFLWRLMLSIFPFLWKFLQGLFTYSHK